MTSQHANKVLNLYQFIHDITPKYLPQHPIEKPERDGRDEDLDENTSR